MGLRFGRLSNERAFLESRVARRLFAVFVACSLLPVAAFALFAYRAVRVQLDGDAAQALRAASKASGMAIAERLSLADASLHIRTRAASDAPISEPQAGAVEPLRRLEKRPADDPLISGLDARALEHMQRGNALIAIGAGAVSPPIRILRRAASEPAAYWIAELDRAFLFPPEQSPATGAFWVVGPGGSVLQASPLGWHPPRTGSSGRSGERTLRIHGEPHVVSSWDLFLAGSFRAEKWTVFSSRPLAEVRRPLREFQAVFPWIAGITLCAALVLCLVQIRRTLVPITALTASAKRVAVGDFGARVEVWTRDEFGTLSEAFNEMAELIGRQVDVLSTVNRVGAALSAEHDSRRLIEMIVQGSMEATGARGGALLLLEEGGDLALASLQLSTGRAVVGESAEAALPLAPVARCLERRTAIRVDDLDTLDADERARWRAFERHFGQAVTGYLSVRLHDEKEAALGALLLVSGEAGAFGDADAALAESLASQATVAIRKNQLVESFRGLFEGLIQLTIGAIDEKSAHTGDHCRKVPVLTELIADAACADRVGPLKDFSLTPEQRYELRIAALLHDCGKVVTPVHVMDKATKLESILDRIGLIEMRFEVLRRDAVLRSLARRPTAAGPDGESCGDEDLASELRSLDADLAFLRDCNVGGEHMADASCERVHRIAGRYRWKSRTGEERCVLEPEEIENLTIRRGTLNDAERKIIQHHVVMTMKMLEQLPFPRDLRNVPAIAGAHHERMDGAGYPLRLRGAQLSVQARILGLADIFEALTARDRPYKPGMTLRETLNILESLSEQGHIDPDLLEIFLRERLHLRYAIAHMDPAQIDPEFQSEIEELTGP